MGINFYKIDALENETISNRKEIDEKNRQIQEQAAEIEKHLVENHKYLDELTSKIGIEAKLLQKVDSLEQDLRNEKLANENLHSEIKEKDCKIQEQDAEKLLLKDQKNLDEQEKVEILEQDLRSERIAIEKLHSEIKKKDVEINEQSANFERRLHDEQEIISELRAKIEASEAQVHSKDDELLKKVDILEQDLQKEKI